MDGLCSSCRGPRDRGRQRTCRACHARYMRQNRKRWPELDAESKRRSIARSYARVYLARGKIQRGRCVCGARRNLVMHHNDYSRPLEVSWLCASTCHRELHRYYRQNEWGAVLERCRLEGAKITRA